MNAGQSEAPGVDARAGAMLVVVSALVLALGVGSARADATTTFTLDQVCTRSDNSNVYVVPFGVTQLRITAVGAAGKTADTSEALATHGGGVGGAGEKVTATVSVTSGEALYTAHIGGGVADYSIGGFP